MYTQDRTLYTHSHMRTQYSSHYTLLAANYDVGVTVSREIKLNSDMKQGESAA